MSAEYELTPSPAQLMQDAVTAYRIGDFARAEQLCGQLLDARPDDVDALNLLGIIKARTLRADEAAALFKRVVAARPENAAAHNNHGNALRDLGRYREALACYDRALSFNPSYGEAYNNRGGALKALGRREDALDSYDSALRLRPEDAEIHYNRSVLLHDLGRLEDAAAGYVRTLKLKADFADAFYNLGHVLHELRRYEEALRCYDRTLELRPDFAQAHNNRGNALRDLGRPEEALTSYARALEVDATLVDAHINRAGTLSELRRFDEALGEFDRARRVQPDLPWLHGDWLQAKAGLCEWSDFESATAELVASIRDGRHAARPLTVLILRDDPALQLHAAQIYSATDNAPPSSLPVIGPTGQRPRIRLGYYSADFYNHATAQLTADLFETHDRTRFELVAFSFGRHRPDAMTDRLRKAFDRFEDVRSLSDREVADVSRQLEIDIAVDLTGFAEDCRPGIFAQRAASLQVSYLGYPGTTGARHIDYMVADATVIPEQERQHYSEKLIILPHSYQVTDRNRAIANRPPTRAELGLPEHGFVYCGFNAARTLAPTVFAGWMRALRAVDGSVLWLLFETDTTAANLRREATRLGVDEARLVFAPPLPIARHLARYRAADLFLDTYPCGAHAAASDALWAGLPVLTRQGQSMAARVGASLLRAVGLPELVASGQDDYEALAIDLGREPSRLAALRGRLESNRRTAPLFDSALYTRHLENGFTQVHARRRAGLPPDDIDVPAVLPATGA